MTTTENLQKFTPRRRRWLRYGLGTLLTAALVGGGLAVIEANAKPGKPEIFLPPGSSDTLRVQWKSDTGVRFKVRFSRKSSMSGASTTGCLPPRADPGEGVTSYHWVQNLASNSTYYFQVAAYTDTACKKQSGGWSSTSNGKKTAAYSYGKPGKPIVNNKASRSLELSFVNVSGAPGYRIRYYSKNGGGQYVWSQVEDLTLTELTRSREYWIKAAVAERSSLSGRPEECTVYSTISCWPSFQQGPYSSEIKVKTSSYTLAAPSTLTVSNQQPYQVNVNWRAGAPLPAGHQYRVQYSKSKSMSGSKYKLAGTGTGTVIQKLASNTNYYMRVYVVRTTSSGNLVAASDKSGFQIAKTRTPFGTISGRVVGPAPQDVQAMVFNTAGEVVDQVDLDSQGRFSANVRPGGHRVKLTYIGSDNFVSSWVNLKFRPYGMPISGSGQLFSVKRGQTNSLGDIRLPHGAELPIRLVTTSGSRIGGADVAAIHAHNSAREVDSVQRTNGDGETTLRGLTLPASYRATPGKYWLRIVASGKKTTSVWVEVKRANPADPGSEARVTRWGYNGGKGTTYTAGSTLIIRMSNA